MAGNGAGGGIALGTGTGSHGVALMNGQDSTGGLWGGGNPLSAALAWLHAPFSTPLDPLSLFLIVGVIAVAIIAWNLILYHVRIAAETI